MSTIVPQTEMIESETEETETGDVYYVVHIHDNHGTINIHQSGQPDPPPPPPPHE